MRTVIIDPPPHFLEERRRLGHDVRDEMWDGVVHVVPSPSTWHQYFAHRLGHVLFPLAQARGLLATHETMLERPGTDRDWRVPDLLYAPFERAAQRGIQGHAALVIEVRSPGDETYEKLPFYAEVGCGEVLVIDRDTCAVELFSLGDAGEYVRTTGSVELASLGATVTTIDGPGVRVTWEGGSADVLL
jgi:Uma2 family endonuclease